MTGQFRPHSLVRPPRLWLLDQPGNTGSVFFRLALHRQKLHELRRLMALPDVLLVGFGLAHAGLAGRRARLMATPPALGAHLARQPSGSGQPGLRVA
jgi:hypothetical protein